MKIYVMVGNIGSGKTTLVKKILIEHSEIVVVSRDALRYMVGAGKYIFNLELEPAIFESARRMIDSLMLTHVGAILVDEVNVSKEYREDYLTLAKLHGYEAVAIIMPKLDKKTCVDRRLQNPHGQDSRSLWEGVWDKFDAIYEEPTMEEGFDRITEVQEWNND